MTKQHLRELMSKEINGRAQREMMKGIKEDWNIVNYFTNLVQNI